MRASIAVAGAALGAALVAGVATAAGAPSVAWGEPESLGVRPAGVHPTLVVDSRGDGAVIWSHRGTGLTAIAIRRGVRTGPPRHLPLRGALTAIDWAAGPGGRVVGVRTRTPRGGADTAIELLQFAGRWSGPAAVATGPGAGRGVATSPAVCVDRRGTAWVGWLQRPAGEAVQAHAHVAARSPAGAWGRAHDLGRSAASAWDDDEPPHPMRVICDAGRPWAVWWDATSGHLRAARHTAAGWRNEGGVALGTGPGPAGVVAAARGANLIVSWSGSQARLAARRAGRPWTAPITLTGTRLPAQVSASADGGLLGAWRTSAGALRTRALRPGVSRWSAPATPARGVGALSLISTTRGDVAVFERAGRLEARRLAVRGPAGGLGPAVGVPRRGAAGLATPAAAAGARALVIFRQPRATTRPGTFSLIGARLD